MPRKGKGYERHGNKWRVVRRVDGTKEYLNFATEEEAAAYVASSASRSARRSMRERMMEAPSQDFLRAAMTKGRKTTPTVLDFARELIESGDLRSNTRRMYRVALRKIEGTGLADLQVGRVTASDLRAFFNQLDANVSNVRAVLTKMFNAAIREGHRPDSPMFQANIRTRKPSSRVKRARLRALTADQLETLARAAGNERDALCIRLGGYVGLRAGEVGGLRVEDIDVQGCRIYVRRNAQRAEGGGVEFGDPKTAMSERDLAVPCSLVEDLAAYMRRHPPLADGTIFYSSQRGPLTNGSLTRATVQAAKKAGLYRRDEDRRQWPTFHKLRNTCASLLIAAKLEPKAVQEYLGHATLAMTFDLYGDLFPKADQPLADAMGALRAAAERRALPPGDWNVERTRTEPGT
jgi:integrase